VASHVDREPGFENPTYDIHAPAPPLYEDVSGAAPTSTDMYIDVAASGCSEG